MLGTNGPEVLLHQIFLCCLPSYVQDALVGTDISDLESLGARADDIMAWPRHPGPLAFNVVAQDPHHK